MQKIIPGNARFTVILLMGLLTAIGPLSIDMYLPAFPGYSQAPAYRYIPGDAVTFQLLYRYFGRAVIVWPAVRALRTKTAIIRRTPIVFRGIGRLRLLRVCAGFDRIPVIPGIGRLRRDGNSKSDGT